MSKTEKETDDRKEYVIDLKKIEDRFSTDWWNKLDPFTFGFWTRIPLISYCRVKEFDILIQKEKKEEDRFIKVQYFQIINGKPEFLGMDNNKAKGFLGTTLLDYIIKHNKLPFGCHYIKEFKNGNVQIDFTPTKWDNFAIHLEAKEAKKIHDIPDLMELTHDLESETNNPAIKRKKTTPPTGEAGKSSVKHLTKEEYRKKMKQVEEKELFPLDALEKASENENKPKKDKAKLIEEELERVEREKREGKSEQKSKTPITSENFLDMMKSIPESKKTPVATNINLSEVVSYIKERDKGDGVAKALIIEKFGSDVTPIIEQLCQDVKIYKIKTGFYASY